MSCAVHLAPQEQEELGHPVIVDVAKLYSYNELELGRLYGGSEPRARLSKAA